MRIVTSLKSLHLRKTRGIVGTIGNFDGVHAGHRKLLNAVVREAKRQRKTSAVITFKEHPQRVIQPDRAPSVLTNCEHKMRLLAGLGIQLCVLLDFRKVRNLSPNAFFEKLMARIKIVKLFLGYNFRFGHSRTGTIQDIKRLAQTKGFQFRVVEAVKKGNVVVSSTTIRKLVLKGNLKKANQMLDRPFSVMATVVKGVGRGTALGFPTANLDIHSEAVPEQGVWAVEVDILQTHFNPRRPSFNLKERAIRKNLKGVLNFGRRPTFSNWPGTIVPEVHLLDFYGRLVEATVEVTFLKKLRDEKRFESPEDLVQQIQRDIVQARSFFEKEGFVARR